MKKPNYPSTFFRIPAESTCGKELGKLLRAMEHVENAASEKALKLGASQYEPNQRTGAGGIGMLYFSKYPDAEQYEIVECVTDEETGETLHAVIPNDQTEAGRALMEELAQLPIVPASVILQVLGLKVLRTKNGVKMPAFQLIEEEGRKWYYLSTFGAEFLPGQQERLYHQGMERVSPKKYKKQAL